MNPDHGDLQHGRVGELEPGIDIGKGRGYVQAEENKREGAAIGTIAMDAIFTPIRNVQYEVRTTVWSSAPTTRSLIFN
jgi:DNA-directed RNA polymerase subunit alpha